MKRYEELDSLRGLAAMSVLFSHYYLVFNGGRSNPFFIYGPWRLLIAGEEAVMLFFVLSGLVLSLPFFHGRQPVAYGPFLAKRICRIYLPYLASLLFCLCLMMQLRPQGISALSPWFNSRWTSESMGASLLGHFFLVGYFDTDRINPVVWTLVHEMRISIIFPFVAMAVAGARFRWMVLLTLFLAAGCLLAAGACGGGGLSLINSANYTGLFILGALIAKYRGTLDRALAERSSRTKLAFLVAGIAVYLYAKPSFVLHLLRPDLMTPILRTVIDSWFIAFGAAIIVVMSLNHNGVSSVLKRPAISYLGRISFSLYLWHLPILYGSLYVFHGTLALWAAAGIAFAATFLIASLSYHTIEVSSIALGKALAGYMAKSSVGPTPGAITTVGEAAKGSSGSSGKPGDGVGDFRPAAGQRAA